MVYVLENTTTMWGRINRGGGKWRKNNISNNKILCINWKQKVIKSTSKKTMLKTKRQSPLSKWCHITTHKKSCKCTMSFVSITIWRSKFRIHLFIKKILGTLIVATPLWPSVGVKPNTSKVGDLESFGTPKCLEFDNKAQNTLHWGVLGVIGKGLEA